VSARLSAVSEQLGGIVRGGDPELVDATHDTRSLTPGGLFCAVTGSQADGHALAGEAATAGAAAILVERWVDVDIAQLQVPSVRGAMGHAAAVIHGHPTLELMVLGVTGTNGKTTVTTILEAILGQAGLGTGVIGTLGTRIHGSRVAEGRTTPEATDLQRTLRTMRQRGVDAVAMEVSSHGLALHRVDGVRFDTVAFTNLGHDHLDFHGDRTSYLAAKARLFQPDLARRGVVLQDAPGAAELLPLVGIPITTVGSGPQADLRVTAREVHRDGSRATLHTPDGPLEVTTGLIGDFNLDNALCAAATALIAGLPPAAIVAGIRAATPPAGRFEPVASSSQEPLVLVDYAHTPDAIAAVVRAGRALVPTGARLRVVLGAGGDRDREKRAAMGVAAAEADAVVVTDDNPRGEDPATIRAAILAGVRTGVCAEVAEIGDRAQAIRVAIEAADPADVILVLGKGHETTQELAGVHRPFDDREVARDALLARRADG
jgi:UDP-N-acetylmuramoyl-L-alanyl-D-glutamate--2,6-diaminopimelate ligase